MKTKYLIYFSFCIIVFSCKKENVSFDDTKIISANQAFVQNWIVEKRYKEHIVFIDSFENIIQWNRIELITTSPNGEIIYSPIRINKNVAGLVLFRNTNNEKIIYSLIIEIIKNKNDPYFDQKELTNAFYQHKIPQTFNGKIVGYSIDNKFLWEIGYKNGIKHYEKRILKTNGIQEKDKIQFNTITNKSKSQSSNCIAYFLITYWDDGSIDRELIGIVCDDICEITKSLEPNAESRIVKFCTIGKQNGDGSINGGSNGTNLNEDSIISYLSNPCNAATLALLQSKGSGLKNSLDDILTNTFGMSRKYHLNFSDKEYLLNKNYQPSDGYSSTIIENIDGSLTISIYLNESEIASQEAIASTIYHEVIHAYLKFTYPGLYETNNSSHAEMFKNYMPKIQEALINTFPNLDPNSALALSMNGIIDLDQSFGFGLGSAFESFIKTEATKFYSGIKGTQCK